MNKTGSKLICFSLLITLLINFEISSQEIGNAYNENIRLYNVGKNYYNQKDYKSAIIEFNKVIYDDPYFFNAYFKKSYSLYNLNSFDQALKEINKAYKVHNIDHKYFYMIGQFYDKLKQYDLAEFYLDMAINYKRDNYFYYNYRGGLHLEIGNYQKALDDFNILLAEEPNMYNVYFNRGMAKYNLKMKKEACVDWWHAYHESENCKRFYFYKCTKENVEDIKITTKQNIKIEKPVFEWDSESFSAFFGKELKYPPSALHKEEHGMVLVKFTLTENLNIEDINIVHSVSELLDNEAIRVVKQSQKYWKKPTIKNGIPERSELIVPISFIIEEGGINNEYENDSLKLYLQQKKYEKLISTTSKILKSNPFQFDVYNQRKIALNNLNQSDSIYNEEFYNNLKSFNGFFLTEVRSFDKSVKLYFNDLWEITNKVNAKYYRLANWNGYSEFFEGSFVDYSINGNLYSSGEYDFKTKNGIFKMYFSNGNIKQELHFTNNRNNGIWKTYYENGNLRNKLNVDGFKFNLIEQYDTIGNSLLVDGNGMFNYEYLNYNGADTISISGNYKQNKKNGFWKFYINRELIAYDEYKKGDYTQGLLIEDGVKVNLVKPAIGSWIFIPSEILRTEELIEDSNINSNYFWFLNRYKKRYLNPKN